MKRLIKECLKPYWKQVLLTLCFVLIQVYFQIKTINMSKVILNSGIKLNNFSVIYNSGIQMLIYTICLMLAVIVVSYITSYITGKISFNLRSELFNKITSFSLYDFNHFESSSLMNRATSNVSTIQIFMLNLLRSCLLIPFIMIGVIIETFLINYQLALVLTIFFILTIVFMITRTYKSIPLFNKVQSYIDHLNLLLREKVYGVRSIRAFGRQDYETSKFDKCNEESMDATLDASMKLYYIAPVSVLIMNLAVVVIYFFGSIQLQQQMVNVSDLIVFFQYITYFLSSLSLIPFLVDMFPRVMVSSNRIEEVLYFEPTLVNKPKEDYDFADGGCDDFVEFKNVIFGYTGAKDVIADINFSASKGSTTAIIGATGSGKSTLMYLLNRMYDPTFGEILINGHDIKDMDLKELHSHVSFGTQKTMVLNDTVYANVAMNNKDMSREDALKCCEDTLFTDAFRTLNDGIDSLMSEGGSNVSGGQKQRLSLARTIAKDADIYIFDDTFSALDMKTEKIVRENVKNRLKGKTVFMVAQKISTIYDADNILVLDKGRIVNQGTHEYLLDNSEIYQEIFESQSYVNKGDVLNG